MVLRRKLQHQEVLDTPPKSAYLTVAQGNDVGLSRIIYFYMTNPSVHDSYCSVPSSKVSSPLPTRPTTCWQLLHQHTFTDKSHWRLLPLYFENRIVVAFDRRRYVVSTHTSHMSVLLQLIAYRNLVFTGRNEVVAKVMFLQVSVILSTGGGLRRTPPDQGEPPQDQGEPPPEEADPPGPRRTPPREEDCSIRSMSGRYASYWNAFLFTIDNSVRSRSGLALSAFLGVNYYRRRMELREGNVFTHVCPSVSHPVHRVGYPM